LVFTILPVCGANYSNISKKTEIKLVTCLELHKVKMCKTQGGVLSGSRITAFYAIELCVKAGGG